MIININFFQVSVPIDNEKPPPVAAFKPFTILKRSSTVNNNVLEKDVEDVAEDLSRVGLEESSNNSFKSTSDKSSKSTSDKSFGAGNEDLSSSLKDKLLLELERNRMEDESKSASESKSCDDISSKSDSKSHAHSAKCEDSDSVGRSSEEKDCSKGKNDSGFSEPVEKLSRAEEREKAAKERKIRNKVCVNLLE